MSNAVMVFLFILTSCVEPIQPIKKEVYKTNPVDVNIGAFENINEVVENTPIALDEAPTAKEGIQEQEQNQVPPTVEVVQGEPVIQSQNTIEKDTKIEETISLNNEEQRLEIEPPTLDVHEEIKETHHEEIRPIVSTTEQTPTKQEELIQIFTQDIINVTPVQNEIKEEAAHTPAKKEENHPAIQEKPIYNVEITVVVSNEVQFKEEITKTSEPNKDLEISNTVHEEIIEPPILEQEDEIVAVIEEVKSMLPEIINPSLSSDMKAIAKEFLYYSNIAKTPTQIESLSIVFDESLVTKPYIAYCQKIKNNTVPQIVINKSFWNRFNTEYRHQLLFHEMGHCLLGRSHLGASFDNPVSVMNEFIIGSSTYVNKYDYFIKELFNIKDDSKKFIFGFLK
jgi:hypothetical protein